MKDDNQIFDEFQQSLENLKGNFHVLETSIPVDKQMEYFRYSENVKKNMDLENIDYQIEVLNDVHSESEQKKYAMTFLAVSGDVKAYRALEAYSQKNIPVDSDWMQMSLLQAKITLESEFSDQKQIFISTGLGGKDHKLRFYALFKSNNLVSFSPYQVELIKKEMSFFIQEYDGETEEIVVEKNYFTVLFLIDLRVNIKNLLESALNECNQYGDFISRSFVVTNVKKYTEEEIQRELNKNNE